MYLAYIDDHSLQYMVHSFLHLFKADSENDIHRAKQNPKFEVKH